MTKRTAFQHWSAELKERVMASVANRLFSRNDSGIDGFLKRKMLTPKGPVATGATGAETK